MSAFGLASPRSYNGDVGAQQNQGTGNQLGQYPHLEGSATDYQYQGSYGVSNGTATNGILWMNNAVSNMTYNYTPPYGHLSELDRMIQELRDRVYNFSLK